MQETMKYHKKTMKTKGRKRNHLIKTEREET